MLTNIGYRLRDITGQSVTIATFVINLGVTLELTWRDDDHNEFRFNMELTPEKAMGIRRIRYDDQELEDLICDNLTSWLTDLHERKQYNPRSSNRHD